MAATIAFMTTPDPESIDPGQIRCGPIRHESLPLELQAPAQAVYRIIGRHLGSTLEQFEIDLMRDEQPERELAAWCGIAATWFAYHKYRLSNMVFREEQETRIVGALLLISAEEQDPESLDGPP